MSTGYSKRFCICFVAFLGISEAHAQHTLERTITVDPSGRADQLTIQAGINDGRIGTDPSVRFTVLIYAGTYNENVTLDETKENVDLVGIDRDSVIIAPSSGDGIVITSGTETSRNNSIRNLTIKTDDGHGIKIVKGGTPVPKDIAIQGVTIEATGDGKHGIEGSAADTVRIFDCNIAADGHLAFGVRVGDNFGIISSVVTATGTSPGGAPSAKGVDGNGKDGVRIRNCRITGSSLGLNMQGQPENLHVYGSEIRGQGNGVFLWNGADVVFEACHIVGEGSTPSTTGFFVDGFVGPAGDVTLLGCRIEAIGAGTGDTIGAYNNTDVDAIGQLRLINCDISAAGTNSGGGSVFGIGPHGAITMIGGTISTSAVAQKETEVWDISDGPVGTIRMSGTTMSKWKGPIFPAGRPRSVTQRTIDVDNKSIDAVLAETTLTAAEQEITAGITDPDVYRVLSVTGNTSGMDQDVFVVGTNWADDSITDKITLSGIATVDGLKPFKSVTKIILPSQNGASETVKVGTTSKLGFYYPLADADDVLQQGRKASLATSYTLESVGTIPTDGIVYSWVDISSINDGDSFEWALLTPQ